MGATYIGLDLILYMAVEVGFFLDMVCKYAYCLDMRSGNGGKIQHGL